jgi:hypothetical protein
MWTQLRDRLATWCFDLPLTLTAICTRDESTWVSGQSRPATLEEVKQFTAKALAWFS